MDEEYNYARMLRQLIVSYLITIIVFVITPIGTVVLSRGLSLSEFGVYSLFFTFWNIGLHTLPQGLQLFVQNYLPGRSVSEQRDVIGSISRWVAVCVLLTGIAWVVYGRYALQWLKLEEYYTASLFVVGASMVLGFGFIPNSLLNARHELEFTNFLYGVNSSVWIIASAIEFFVWGQIVVWHVFLYWLVGALLQLGLNLWKLGKESVYLIVPLKIDGRIVLKGLAFGVPLVLLSGSQWLLTSFDRMFLARFAGAEAVGFYSLGYALCAIVFSFGNLVPTIFYPYVAKAWNVKHYPQYEVLINAMLKYTLSLVIPGIVGVFVMRESLITLIAGYKFLSAAPFVQYLVMFPLFASLIVIVQIVLMVREKSVVIGFSYVVGILLNYLLNFFLVKRFGVDGAVGATLITYVSLFLFLLLKSWKYLSFDKRFIKTGRIVLAAAVMGVVIANLTPTNFLSKIGVIVSGVLVYSILLIILRVFGVEEWSVVKSLFSRRDDHNI